MTLTDILDLLQPIIDRWPLVLLALVLVTLLGIPARNLVGATATLLRAPSVPGWLRCSPSPVRRRGGGSHRSPTPSSVS
jgi:hypothetical protein